VKYLITGGAGFIGSNLVDELIKISNNDITIIDNLKTGKIDFINDLIKTKKIEFIKSDIKNKESYPKKPFDVVFHLSANADVRGGLSNTIIDLEENVIGTHLVLEFMRKNDIKKLVFASSSAVYGEHKIIPTPENVPDIKPISHYGASKFAAEAFISSYCHTYDIKAWMFRFANVVGNRCTHGVIPDFVNKLKKDPDLLEILGDGNQEKSFFDVKDCVNGLIEVPKLDKNIIVESYNLANNETIKVKDLAKIVVDEMGLNNTKYEFTGGDRGWIGDVPVTILSIDKAKKLGWTPKISGEEAIRRTVRYHLLEDFK
jgi:UDP-glucose 4-epimerase